jgi:zinc protease
LQQIITPDKANAVYVAGMAFPMKDSDPDYPALMMGNYVLGAGALSSRLGDRVRQKEGLSYGVRSYLSADSVDPRASLTINAICNPKNIEKVNNAISEELARLLADGVTPPELDKAKQGYLQQMQVARTSDSALVATLADCLFADRTMAFYGDLERKVASLTPPQVLETMRKYIDPKKLVIVDAGDFAPDTSASKGSAVK